MPYPVAACRPKGQGVWPAAEPPPGWTPDVLSPIVWYDIQDAGAVTLDGADIVTLENKGSLGTDLDVTQGLAGSRPTLVGSLGEQGSYASCDGGDYWKTSGTPAMISSAANFSVGFLYRQPVVQFAALFTQDRQDPVGRVTILAAISGTYVDLGPDNTARVSGELSGATIGDVEHIIVAIRDGADVNVYIDGNQTAALSRNDASGTNSGSSTFFLMSFTADVFMPNGSRFYEAVFVGSSLSDVDRDKLAGYLAWRHGAEGILHESNPYVGAAP